MAVLAEISAFSGSTLLLAGGAVGLYAASRAAVGAMARPVESGRPIGPGRLALGHWAPVAAAAWVATLYGRADIAAEIIFGTSVAALSLAMGMTTYLAAPVGPLPARRAWPFLLAAALLPLLAGMTGHLSAGHTILMLALGGCALLVWEGSVPPDASLQSVLETPQSGPPRPKRFDFSSLAMRSLQWVLALGLAFAGAKAVVLAAIDIGGSSRDLPAILLSAVVLSPLLILPAIASGSELAQRNRTGLACASLVALTLLNLCALLPAVVLAWYVRSAIPAGGGILAAFPRLWQFGQPFPLPLSTWRLDAVLLTVVSFALIPIALGRWTMTRLESVGLLLGYAAYLAATVSLTKR